MDQPKVRAVSALVCTAVLVGVLSAPARATTADDPVDASRLSDVVEVSTFRASNRFSYAPTRYGFLFEMRGSVRDAFREGLVARFFLDVRQGPATDVVIRFRNRGDTLAEARLIDLETGTVTTLFRSVRGHHAAAYGHPRVFGFRKDVKAFVVLTDGTPAGRDRAPDRGAMKLDLRRFD